MLGGKLWCLGLMLTDRRLPLLRRPEHEVVEGVADAGVLPVVCEAQGKRVWGQSRTRNRGYAGDEFERERGGAYRRRESGL